MTENVYVHAPYPPRPATIVVKVPGRQGPAGAPGGPGPPGPAGGAFVFTQAAPAASWAIAHTLGRLPLVSVYDAAGNELIADVSVTATSVNIVFATATAGSALIA